MSRDARRQDRAQDGRHRADRRRSASWATRRSSSIPATAPQALHQGPVIMGTPGAGPHRTSRQTLGDRADSVLLGAQADREQAHRRRAARDADGARGHAQGGTAHDGGLRRPEQGPTASSPGRWPRCEQVSARLDSTLASPALSRTLDRADTLTANLAAMTAQFTATGARLDTLLCGMNQGRGHPRQVRHRHGALLRHARAVAVA